MSAQIPTLAAAAGETPYHPVSDSEDGSEFDELFDSDDEVATGTGDKKDKKPKKRPNDIATILRGQLVVPRHTLFNTKYLHDLIHQGNVELNPAYQRDVVWPEAKMIGLIQSLFMNYYIPPVIFAVAKSENEEEVRVCIDGKQRCTSILYFMDGKIPFVSPHTKEKFWYSKHTGGRTSKPLPDVLRRKFDMVQIQAVEYNGIPDEQQRDIFQRVQLGVALSAAEKLQALAGPWAKWLGELQTKYITEPDTLSDKLGDWDTKRSKAYQALVAIVMLAHDKVTPSANTMKTFLDRADPPEEGFKDRIALAMGFFVNIATNHYETAFGTVNKRLAPVEFWFIAYLIYLLMGHLSLETMAKHIGQMRREVHANYAGVVRANGPVMGFLRDFIKRIPKKRSLGEQPAAEEYEADEDIDARNQRALRRQRKNMEQDPTYQDEGIDRVPGGAEMTVTTRARATNTAQAATPASAPTAPRDTTSRDIKPLPRQLSANGNGVPEAAPTQTRPPPAGITLSQAQPSPILNSLPTPQTGSPYQAYQQPVNPYQPQPQQAQQQVQQQAGQHGANPYGQFRPQQTYSPQVQYQQPNAQAQVTWINGQPMTAEQVKQYTQARLEAQVRQRQAQGQGYGR